MIGQNNPTPVPTRRQDTSAPLVLGLTGPIASGKSSVAQMLSKLGAYIIDADKIGHEIITPHSPAWNEIVTAFGSGILQGDDLIDRKKLGALVFGNIDKLKLLNNIMHPRILNRIQSLISEACSKYNLIVIDAAVLKEMKLIPLVDKVWVVLADKENRIRRLEAQGLKADEALARIESQSGEESFREIADVVVENNGTIDELQEKVKKEFIKLGFKETRNQ